MAINYTQLKSECLNDPTGLGLTAQFTAGNDSIVADILNLARVSIQIKRADIAAADIIVAILVADFPALGANPNSSALSQERRLLSWFEAAMNVPVLRLLNDDGTDTPVKANFAAMFPDTTGTWSRLVALATRPGSRAEQLFGAGTFLTASDIAIARNS